MPREHLPFYMPFGYLVRVPARVHCTGVSTELLLLFKVITYLCFIFLYLHRTGRIDSFAGLACCPGIMSTSAVLSMQQDVGFKRDFTFSRLCCYLCTAGPLLQIQEEGKCANCVVFRRLVMRSSTVRDWTFCFCFFFAAALFRSKATCLI